MRDALKALTRETGGNPVLKIRAFVAGSGDLRRVRDLVSEVFTDRKQPLPALSLIQSGGLPLEGAQVVLEAIAAGKKEVNPRGLVFLSAPVATSDNPLDPVAPLAAQSLERLKARHQDRPFRAFRRRACHLLPQFPGESGRHPETGGSRLSPGRAQLRANPALPVARPCRLRSRRAAQLEHRHDTFSSSREEGEPQAALVAAQHVVLTGTQVSYGYQESNSRLAFERLQKVLEAAGVSGRDVAFAHYYPLADPARRSGAQAALRFLHTRPPDRCYCSKASPAWTPASPWTLWR